ncbi:MAG: twin-arginine translocation signal domain-containing protein [Gemmataceae bacterium]|nr:twin-arginine translocation signal domain-containing protein [Gemmataceae bacterium]
MSAPIDRRRFLQTTAGLGAAAAGLSISAEPRDPAPGNQAPAPNPAAMLPPRVGPLPLYPDNRPRVILFRFGGGVRRQETIADPDRTWCPFVYHELYRNKGVLLNNVVLEDGPNVITSHAEGTLYLLTGKYEFHKDTGFGRTRYEAHVPTLFEYLRSRYDVPTHEALIVNGEDRIDEEFLTFSNTPHYGVHYRSTVLSLYRFKTFVLRDELAHGRVVRGQRVPLTDEERRSKQQELTRMQNLGERVRDLNAPSPQLDAFWDRWRAHYGTSGFINPRGDRLLTTLSLWALRHLRPKLMMINYQDPDYVHWGNRNFYTRAIAIIDEGIREIYNAVQADEEYRDRTVFLVVPDCGRDSNRCMPIPYQHHFNTRSAREIFVIAAGPGIVRSQTPVDRKTQQISVTASVGQIMGFHQPQSRFVDAGPLEIHA